MAGETVKTSAVCLGVRRWSRTSHVVTWMTPEGKISTIAKGAERPKSFLLGQYDANYTCEIVYYARAKSGLHALRECSPLKFRESLRKDWRRLALMEYFRYLVAELAPSGPDAKAWMELLETGLDREEDNLVARMLEFEIAVLRLAGLSPSLTGCKAPESPFYIDTGSFTSPGMRQMPVSIEVASTLARPVLQKNLRLLLDAARVIGVYYSFHLDFPVDVRRNVLKLIANEKGNEHEND
ncbi:MAG: recombination protein O N-terminal domain-containing protein [Kiritimatiellae bacterium]|nr:recombination protein O N-terminal domain-containing protein [Kiritimatiellia bacterium]